MRENRRTKRFKRGLKVTWGNEEFLVESLTRDISASGVFIITSRSIEPGDIVQLEFESGNPRPSIRCSGRVVWVNRGQVECFPPGFGVEMLDMDDYSKELLLIFCDECGS